MSSPKPIEYSEANPAVREVFDDIMSSRNVADVNNFWKYLANDSKTLKRTWESLKEIMAVVGMANETNGLVNGYRVPIDPAFK